MDLHFRTATDGRPAPGAGRDASRLPPETFEIFIDDDRYAVPTLYLVPAADEARAVAIAERLVAESRHHLGAELCLDGQRIGGVGSFAQPQSPPNSPSRLVALDD